MTERRRYVSYQSQLLSLEYQLLKKTKLLAHYAYSAQRHSTAVRVQRYDSAIKVLLQLYNSIPFFRHTAMQKQALKLYKHHNYCLLEDVYDSQLRKFKQRHIHWCKQQKLNVSLKSFAHGQMKSIERCADRYGYRIFFLKKPVLWSVHNRITNATVPLNHLPKELRQMIRRTCSTTYMIDNDSVFEVRKYDIDQRKHKKTEDIPLMSYNQPDSDIVSDNTPAHIRVRHSKKFTISNMLKRII